MQPSSNESRVDEHERTGRVLVERREPLGAELEKLAVVVSELARADLARDVSDYSAFGLAIDLAAGVGLTC